MTPGAAADLDPAITERRGEVNGLAFTWLEAGAADASLALCLHGFPDTPRGWRWLLPRLADAGFHAIAPYARGYAPTAVPESGISALPAWIADANALHEQFGHQRAGVLIGHDWGAEAAYGIANIAPDRWERVVVMSVPPIDVLMTRLIEFEQVRAFWYQYLFLQGSAETIVFHDDMVFLEKLWRSWSPGFDPSDEIGHVKDALREPANLTAAIGTYRSMYGAASQPPEYAAELAALFGRHSQPTLYLHGADDGCIFADVVEPTLAVLPPGSRAESIAGAGHFLQYERADLVNDLVLDFIRARA